MASLYNLTEEYLQLLEMMAEPMEGEEEVLADTFEALNGEFEEKAEGYAMVIRSAENDAEAISAEIKRLQERKKTIENNIDRMKKTLKGAMETTGKEKFKTPLFSFGIQLNPAKLVLLEGVELPEKYLIPQPPKVDNAAIKEDLKNGLNIPGASLVRERGLRIR